MLFARGNDYIPGQNLDHERLMHAATAPTDSNFAAACWPEELGHAVYLSVTRSLHL